MDDFESCIDDSCPTIWGPTSSRPRDALYEAVPQQLTRPRHNSIRQTLPAVPQSVASAGDGRVRPIEGALLRKLFQATMDEKRKAEEKGKAAQQPFQEHSEELTKALNEVAVSKGFYVLNAGRQSAKGGDEKGIQKAEPTPDVLGKDKQAGKKGMNKEKAAIAAAAQDEAFPRDNSAHEGAENDNGGSVAPAVQESKEGKPRNLKKPVSDSKQQKQGGKLSKKEKKKLKQAEKERAKDGEALMSGGLSADQNQTVGKQDDVGEVDDFVGLAVGKGEPIEQEKATPRSAAKSETTHLQPTVESMTSSRSSKHKRTSKPHSTRSAPQNNIFPRATSIKKPASFVSWEEIGQGVVGEEVVRIASMIASSNQSSKATSKHKFEGFDRVWKVPEGEVGAYQQHSSRHELKVSSRRSSKRGENETHSPAHVTQARHSRASRPSQIRRERVKFSSESSTNKTRSALANETDSWAQNDVSDVVSNHDSSRHSSEAASQRTFEELGEGWHQATPEAPRSRVSACPSHSKPLSFNGNSTTSQVWSQLGSEKAVTSKVNTHRSSAGTFEEIGEGWQGQDGVEIVARSRRSSVHSRKVSSLAWKANGQDDERSGVPISQHRPEETSQRWVAVDEPRSTVRTAQSVQHSCETNDSDAHLEATRPTVFAGKGWISPHPLSRSPTEMASPPQSKIVLPSKAFPHGATMTYEQWKEVQEEGMRQNISPTESHMTINARRAQSRHRVAGWGAHSPDGHRFEEVTPEAEDHVGDPASYRVPSMDSERSSGDLLSDERPPIGHTGQEYGHELSWVGTWEEQHPVQSIEQSGRHSRVQTLSQWSHEHSGSKRAHEGSEAAGSDRSRDSSKLSSRHDSSRNAHQSSRQSGQYSKSHHSSRRCSERHTDRSDDGRSGTPKSQMRSIGWGRLSLGTARSRQSHQSGGRDSRRSSHHTSRHSLHAQSKPGSDDWQGSGHSSGGSSQRIRHSSPRESRDSEERAVSTRSHGLSNAWRQSSNKSQHSRHESRHPGSRHSSHHSSSALTKVETASAQNSSQASVNSSERVMEAMEEGRNVWSDVPQYDGPTSNHESIERSGVSTPTSQLYWKRYQGNGDQEPGMERWD